MSAPVKGVLRVLVVLNPGGARPGLSSFVLEGWQRPNLGPLVTAAWRSKSLAARPSLATL